MASLIPKDFKKALQKKIEKYTPGAQKAKELKQKSPKAIKKMDRK